jgi:hypothetical protein
MGNREEGDTGKRKIEIHRVVNRYKEQGERET